MDMRITMETLLALCGGVTVVGGAISILIKWLSPVRESKKEIADVKKMLARDKQRLDDGDDRMTDMKRCNDIQMRSMLALLNHEITGNDVAKLQAAQKEITDYLTNR